VFILQLGEKFQTKNQANAKYKHLFNKKKNQHLMVKARNLKINALSWLFLAVDIDGPVVEWAKSES